MGVPAARQQLSVLTHLGHSLPGATSPQKAALEVARTLIRLGVAVSVSTVEADQAVLVAARAPLGAAPSNSFPRALASWGSGSPSIPSRG